MNDNHNKRQHSNTATTTTGETTTTTTNATNHQITGPISREEIAAYAKTAERGDVLPACMRLALARADGSWTDRTALCMAVGPACPIDVLEMACAFMPRAAEPRLLRAAAKMVFAGYAPRPVDRDALLHSARHDLDEAAVIDPSDVTARVLLAELARVTDSFRYAA